MIDFRSSQMDSQTSPMRLDKYISQVTDYSRKQVKALLKANLVTLDGQTVSDPSLHIVTNQVVAVDGETLSSPSARYFMLNKPLGYICATKDSSHPVVLDLLDEPNKDKLQIAGRLDIDTTGLVLITDDGQWNHSLTSPNHKCDKTYYVCTAEAITHQYIEKFAKGIMLEGETKRTRPAVLDILFANEARLTISEGKYHQVKRMFAAMGNRVEELHRESIGGILLDKDLPEGDYRPLTEEEIGAVGTTRRR